MLCPHCGQRLWSERDWTRADPNAPGLSEILRGHAGLAWRAMVTAALIVAAVLLIVGVEMVLAV